MFLRDVGRWGISQNKVARLLHYTRLKILIDKRLLRDGTYNQFEADMLVAVALRCISKDPRKRPDMQDVLWELEGRNQVRECMGKVLETNDRRQETKQKLKLAQRTM
ncbi:hypothetical protein GIB67_011113 [Kingdonia uniflora]|uniref:Uncharacterized protein n=1 Tax=Kingdonia uniflora TaxID=39325 RepID=A0A7J7NSA8_9MAGN|nr:hypothetical protein GIB67_042815 [Kingdonia uniflora]KAF6176324.1 hypothetical protein GIB67_011113 [Kingdonia uniflora]